MSRLAPTVSTLARQTMRAAFEELERTVTPADANSFRSTTLAQVREAALAIETQLSAKQSLRNMRRLAPLLKGLEHYAGVVGILCNGTPFLPWVWAPISLILRIASEYVEAFEQLMKGYSRIADVLARFRILSEAFVSSPDFQQTLAIFYADILQFHTYAYKFVRRSGWRLLFLTSWGRFQRRFDNILENLQRHGDLIDQEANARNIGEASRMRHELRTWREESLARVQRDEEERTAKQYREILSWLKIDETEQLSIFEAIADEAVKYPGTCDWIVQHPKISSWLSRKPDNPFIWLQGNPGTGKSAVSSRLVNFIRTTASATACHFCTYSYLSSTRYESIIRSILLQLLRGSSEFVAHVYQGCILTKKSPSITFLEQLISTMSANLADKPRETEYLWIVLDGLDECEPDKQPRLLSLLNQLVSKSAYDRGTRCKVLVSSRYSSVLAKYLRKKQVVSLSDESTHLNNAIQKYALQRLQASSEMLRQLELELEDIEGIANAVSEKADGMFLYARLVLDYATTNIFYDGEEIKKSIHQLPQSLADFYHKILTQILAGKDSRSVDRIKTILSWIAFARRPLKRLELLSAVSFSLGDSNVERLVPQYILEICSPLIEERRDTSLSFIHSSLKEFLQSPSSDMVIDEREALREHGVAAVTCLLSGMQIFEPRIVEQKNLIRLIKGVHGLHVYATEYWVEYLLCDATATNGPDMSSPLMLAAWNLTHRLEERATTEFAAISIHTEEGDERLRLFQEQEILFKHIGAAIRSRSRKRLRYEFLQKQGNDSATPQTPFAIDGISCMLQVYENTVQSLLHEDFHPGVSAEELDVFKNHFRASAFTCRLRSCPRATIGFDCDEKRREHEMTHAGGFRCTYPDCQYPSFPSSQALKTHAGNCHSLPRERRPIRRVRAMEARPLNNSGVRRRVAGVSPVRKPTNSPIPETTGPPSFAARRPNNAQLPNFELPPPPPAENAGYTAQQHPRMRPPEGQKQQLNPIYASKKSQVPKSAASARNETSGMLRDPPLHTPISSSNDFALYDQPTNANPFPTENWILLGEDMRRSTSQASSSDKSNASIMVQTAYNTGRKQIDVDALPLVIPGQTLSPETSSNRTAFSQQAMNGDVETRPTEVAPRMPQWPSMLLDPSQISKDDVQNREATGRVESWFGPPRNEEAELDQPSATSRPSIDLILGSSELEYAPIWGNELSHLSLHDLKLVHEDQRKRLAGRYGPTAALWPQWTRDKQRELETLILQAESNEISPMDPDSSGESSPLQIGVPAEPSKLSYVPHWTEQYKAHEAPTAMSTVNLQQSSPNGIGYGSPQNASQPHFTNPWVSAPDTRLPQQQQQHTLLTTRDKSDLEAFWSRPDELYTTESNSSGPQDNTKTAGQDSWPLYPATGSSQYGYGITASQTASEFQPQFGFDVQPRTPTRRTMTPPISPPEHQSLIAPPPPAIPTLRRDLYSDVLRSPYYGPSNAGTDHRETSHVLLPIISESSVKGPDLPPIQTVEIYQQMQQQLRGVSDPDSPFPEWKFPSRSPPVERDSVPQTSQVTTSDMTRHNSLGSTHWNAHSGLPAHLQLSDEEKDWLGFEECRPCRISNIKCDRTSPSCNNCNASSDLCTYPSFVKERLLQQHEGVSSTGSIADNESMNSTARVMSTEASKSMATPNTVTIDLTKDEDDIRKLALDMMKVATVHTFNKFQKDIDAWSPGKKQYFKSTDHMTARFEEEAEGLLSRFGTKMTLSDIVRDWKVNQSLLYTESRERLVE